MQEKYKIFKLFLFNVNFINFAPEKISGGFASYKQRRAATSTTRSAKPAAEANAKPPASEP